jgi:methylmalonyl-CoA mutase C-terminal domain/subunit
MNKRRKIKVLIAKTALDGHNRGIKVISRWLMEAGMEVVFLGQYQTEDMVIKAAKEEDVDVIGLSFLGGEHLYSVKMMQEKMEKEGLDEDVLFIVGGVIPKEDIGELYKMGVDRVFLPGTPMEQIVEFIENNVKEKKRLPEA